SSLPVALPIYFWRGHAADGLVDEQQLRILHEQHPDLEPLLLSVRERASAHVDDFLQTDRLQHRIEQLALRRRKRLEQRRPHAFVARRRELEVIEDCGLLEYCRLFEL